MKQKKAKRKEKKRKKKAAAAEEEEEEEKAGEAGQSSIIKRGERKRDKRERTKRKVNDKATHPKAAAAAEVAASSTWSSRSKSRTWYSPLSMDPSRFVINTSIRSDDDTWLLNSVASLRFELCVMVSSDTIITF